MIKKIKNFFRGLRKDNPYKRTVESKRYKKSVAYLRARPFVAFFLALGILLFIIILGSVISNLQKKEVVKTTPVKEIQVFSIGKTPTVLLQAQVESKGVITIVAQTAGIVQEVKVAEGEAVTSGQTLVSLSSTYQGGNAPVLQAQLAGAQLKNINDTYDLQKSIINDQRSVATASAENTEQLRRISEASVGETESLISTSEDLLDTLNEALAAAPPEDQPAIQGQVIQLQGAINQLRNGLRNTQYQVNTSNPPTTLSNVQKDMALKQLDVQEKALNLNREVSRIQYKLALVQQAVMFPASPFNGTVEHINVQVGQSVSPGTVIATVKSDDMHANVVLRAPRNIAQSVSRVEPSVFLIDGKKIELLPTYVSSVATDGQLHTITYTLPQDVSTKVTGASYIPVQVPIGYANTSSEVPFIPIDSVYESQSTSTVFLAENGKAVSRTVEIGPVYGGYVEVISGLKSGDQVITDRNVVAGDQVKITQ